MIPLHDVTLCVIRFMANDTGSSATMRQASRIYVGGLERFITPPGKLGSFRKFEGNGANRDVEDNHDNPSKTSALSGAHLYPVLGVERLGPDRRKHTRFFFFNVRV